MKLPVSYYDTNLLGDIISKMSYDIDTINTSLSSDIISICTSIITVSGSFMMMLTISPILVLIFVFTIPVSLLFSRFMLKRTKDLFRARSRSLGELNGFVEEMITGTKTIKAYSKEDKILEVFDEYNNSRNSFGYDAETMSYVDKVMEDLKKMKEEGLLDISEDLNALKDADMIKNNNREEAQASELGE